MTFEGHLALSLYFIPFYCALLTRLDLINLITCNSIYEVANMVKNLIYNAGDLGSIPGS